ncbi:hypothetical protein [Noviherbaspirillum autotrophicum]|uniref:Uncharacterized protein n=1 Tax=Noviherbaspirillum autotrophicum TaxID=709839 RepID=A0A0C1YLW6_9BURK|nr:hypothetical protein [Noviherbaspirillum autotrophicum]KIF81487.1 hypothetical protein TSA66_12805 [Noviherbaspirillum autotrophicum]
MQTLSYTVGQWRAEAQIEELETGKLMAVISVTDDKGTASADSKHTVVFEHQAGMDTGRETEVLVRRLLRERYGI